MLSIELTETQAAQLEAFLQAQGETELYAAVVAARRRAQGLVQCAVCGTWFAGGRAKYCGAACKQQAYRQRVRNWRRRSGPHR